MTNKNDYDDTTKYALKKIIEYAANAKEGDYPWTIYAKHSVKEAHLAAFEAIIKYAEALLAGEFER